MTARAHPGHAALVAALAVLVLALFAGSAAIGAGTCNR